MVDETLPSAPRLMRMLDSLYAISAAAASAESRDAVLEAIYEQTSQIMKVDAFVAALYNTDREQLELALQYDHGQRFPVEWIDFDPEVVLSARVMEQRSPLLIDAIDLEVDESAMFGSEEPVRAWLGVPLIAQGEVIGALAVQSYTANVFDETDIRLLTLIGQQAALAILSYQARSESQRRLNELHQLNELGRELSALVGSASLIELMERVRRWLFSTMGADDFLVAVYDQQTDIVSFPFAFTEGRRHDVPARKRGNGLTEHVLRNAVPIRINGSVFDYLAQHQVSALSYGNDDAIVTWMGVPIWLEGRVMGALIIQSNDPSVFYTEQDERLLVAVSNQIAGTIQTSRLLSEEQQRRAELQEANQRQSDLLQVIREISTPIVPVLPGLLAVPLVGSIDSERATQITEALLSEVVSQRATEVLLDITGVPVVDTSTANYLIQTVRATALLGAHCSLVGIRPEVAQTIVGLGVGLEGVTTLANLQEGVTYALARRGLRLEKAGR